jgi:hypothetical protein
VLVFADVLFADRYKLHGNQGHPLKNVEEGADDLALANPTRHSIPQPQRQGAGAWRGRNGQSVFEGKCRATTRQ